MSDARLPSDITQDHINVDDILAVAKLARLQVNTETAQDYADDIDKILAMMNTLDDVSTNDVRPLTNIHEAETVLRADMADADIDRTKNQAIAPATEQGLYLVPQVID